MGDILQICIYNYSGCVIEINWLLVMEKLCLMLSKNLLRLLLESNLTNQKYPRLH